MEVANLQKRTRVHLGHFQEDPLVIWLMSFFFSGGESNLVCKNKELYSSEQVISQRSLLFLCLAAVTLKSESHSPSCTHKKLLTSYLDLSLTKMPFVNRFPEVKPQQCIPIDTIFFSLCHFTTKKKKKNSERMDTTLNIFLVWNFFIINNQWCQVTHVTNSTFPLFGSSFCKKGYSSHCRVSIKFPGFVSFFFSNCGPPKFLILI